VTEVIQENQEKSIFTLNDCKYSRTSFIWSPKKRNPRYPTQNQ